MRSLHLLAAFVVALLSLLVWQNYSLGSRARDLRQQLDSLTKVPVGTKLLPLRGHARGEEVLANTSSKGRPTFVFVFSPDCPACEAAAQSWATLASDNQHVWYLNSGRRAAQDYLERLRIPAQRLIEMDDAAAKCTLNLRATPQTLLLNDSGIVIQSEIGLIGTREIAQFGKLASLNLADETRH